MFVTSILRGIVKLLDDTKGALVAQIVDLEADDPDDDIEVLEPVGVHFLPSLDEDMAIFESSGSGDNRFAMGASQRGHRPTGLTAAGTGGLHYLGTYRLFLDDDGTTHVGKRDPEDFVALRGLTRAEFDDFKADLDAFKTKFDTHTHLVSTTGTAAAQTGTAAAVVPAQQFPTPHTPGEVGSTTVRCE